MRRRQLFEFEDLPWFPALLREYMTDYLRHVSEQFDLFGPAVPVLRDLLRETGETRIVDLGSGGGGSWGTLAPRLASEVPGLSVTLTDLYPNLPALTSVERRVPGVVRVERGPVDATAVPARLEGVRTQFLSLHHFPASVAVSMLRSAVEAGRPIAVFEAQRRDVKHLVQFGLSPLAVLAMTPAIRPFRWGRLLLTYLPPVVPFFVGWDGVVSVLRTWTPDEMRGMAEEADPSRAFRWEAGELEGKSLHVPYLVGRPS